MFEAVKRGETKDYLARRLARDAPEILAAYGRGEYPTIKEAAKAAGIPLGNPSVRLSPDPKKAAKTLIRRFDEHYLNTLAQEILNG